MGRVTDLHRMQSQAPLYLHPTRGRCGGRYDRRYDRRRARSRLLSGFRAAGRSLRRFLKQRALQCDCGSVHERLRQSEPHCVELDDDHAQRKRTWKP